MFEKHGIIKSHEFGKFASLKQRIVKKENHAIFVFCIDWQEKETHKIGLILHERVWK